MDLEDHPYYFLNEDKEKGYYITPSPYQGNVLFFDVTPKGIEFQNKTFQTKISSRFRQFKLPNKTPNDEFFKNVDLIIKNDITNFESYKNIFLL